MPETMVERMKQAFLAEVERQSAGDTVAFNLDSALRAALRAMREPDDEMSVAGLLSLGESMQSEREFWEGRQADVKEYDEAVMPLAVLTARSSRESDAIWQAMIDAALREDT